MLRRFRRPEPPLVAIVALLCALVVLPAVGQDATVTLPGAAAVTGVLDGTDLVLVERTVPAGYMQLFKAFDGSYRNPVVIVEGFDPTNDAFPTDVYSSGNDYGALDIARAAGRSIWIVNFGDGGGALTANAKLVSSAIQIAANWGGLSNAKVDLIGLSMGGVISRYALAYDEHYGGGSDGLVRLFVSGDSPQQGANGPPSLQELILFTGDPSLALVLNCDAALSMLYLSVRGYDENDCFLGVLPSTSGWTGTTAAHDWFYSTLNALNGDGYPNKCRSVAVSNGSTSPQPRSAGDPIYTARTYITIFVRIELCEEVYRAYPGDVAPGSLGEDFAPGNIRTENFELDEHFVATFIPTESALDLRSGVSMFDRTLVQSQALNHSTITAETMDFILEEILGPGLRYNPKYLPDGAIGALYDWIVTAVFPGMFYAEASDRSTGLLVISSTPVQEGNVVLVRGPMSTSGGERRMNASGVTVKGSAQVPGPLGMSIRTLGGAPLGPYTAGIAGATGLNNIGLLVRTTGLVKNVGSGVFYVDDGSGVSLKVSAPGITPPQPGKFVVLTGISSIEPSALGYQRLLKLRSSLELDKPPLPEYN